MNGIEYFLAKTYATGTSGPAAYYMHALNVTNGAEQPGFPRHIAGFASNSPGLAFNATNQFQRPGLIETQGVVYAAFGSSCDHPPTNGWIVGVDPTAKITAM